MTSASRAQSSSIRRVRLRLPSRTPSPASTASTEHICWVSRSSSDFKRPSMTARSCGATPRLTIFSISSTLSASASHSSSSGANSPSSPRLPSAGSPPPPASLTAAAAASPAGTAGGGGGCGGASSSGMTTCSARSRANSEPRRELGALLGYHERARALSSLSWETADRGSSPPLPCEPSSVCTRPISHSSSVRRLDAVDCSQCSASCFQMSLTLSQ
mmetsp:Transcript_36039/g.87564  ORF Transcript_36039/g.87564 Transcript_36039/m.87564 type:complete len:217 (+) Transcript_36039:169-819(+)